MGDSADDKLMTFFLLFPENRIRYFMQIVSLAEIMIRHFMQIVSLGDNLHEMSIPIFWEK